METEEVQLPLMSASSVRKVRKRASQRFMFRVQPEVLPMSQNWTLFQNVFYTDEETNKMC